MDLVRSVSYRTLETERLTLRPLRLDDLQDLASLHAEESFRGSSQKFCRLPRLAVTPLSRFFTASTRT